MKMKNLLATAALIWASLSRSVRFWLVIAAVALVAIVVGQIVEVCQRWQDSRLLRRADRQANRYDSQAAIARARRDTATAQLQRLQPQTQKRREAYQTARRRIDSTARAQRQRAGQRRAL